MEAKDEAFERVVAKAVVMYNELHKRCKQSESLNSKLEQENLELKLALQQSKRNVSRVMETNARLKDMIESQASELSPFRHQAFLAKINQMPPKSETDKLLDIFLNVKN